MNCSYSTFGTNVQSVYFVFTTRFLAYFCRVGLAALSRMSRSPASRTQNQPLPLVAMNYAAAWLDRIHCEVAFPHRPDLWDPRSDLWDRGGIGYLGVVLRPEAAHPVVCELNSDREVAHMQYEKQQKLNELPAGAAVLEADAKLICRLFSPRLL